MYLMLFLIHTFVCLSSFSPPNHNIQGVLVCIVKVMHTCELWTMVQTKDTLPNVHLSPDPLYIPDIGEHVFLGSKKTHIGTYQC